MKRQQNKDRLIGIKVNIEEGKLYDNIQRSFNRIFRSKRN